MRIVVTGSLGNIGKPLTEELTRKGHAVTVISSNPEKQKDIEAMGATAAIGSLEDVDFLTSTFAGADAIHAMVPPDITSPDSRAHTRKIGSSYVQAIQRSGVKRVVYLSSWGAHLDKGTGFIVGHHDVENMLNELPDVAVTHLRAGYIYYNLYSFVGMIKEAGIISSNYGGDDKLVMVAPTDIAAAVAEELETPATGKSVRYVASDERTANEVARVLGAAIGKPDLKWITLTDEQMRSGMEQRGLPAHMIANFVELNASIHSGALGADYEQHKPAKMGQEKLEDFAREFVTVYTK